MGKKSRRDILRGLGVGIIGIGAGCSGQDNSKSRSTTNTSSPRSINIVSESTTRQTSTEKQHNSTDEEQIGPEVQQTEPIAIKSVTSLTDTGYQNGQLYSLHAIENGIMGSGPIGSDLTIASLTPRLSTSWTNRFDEYTNSIALESKSIVPIGTDIEGGFLLGVSLKGKGSSTAVLSIDDSGQKQWDRQITPTEYAWHTAYPTQLSTGRYVVAELRVMADSAQTRLQAFDTPSGETVWEHQFDPVSDIAVRGIQRSETNQENFYLWAEGSTREWVSEYTAEGEQLWRENAVKEIDRIQPLSNGFLHWGRTKTGDTIFKQYDLTQRLKWKNTLSIDDEGLDVTTIAGTSGSELLLPWEQDGNLMIKKIDASGTVRYTRQYNLDRSVKTVHDISVNNDVCFVSGSEDQKRGSDGWIANMKI